MTSFEYTIKDELGIHARPAGTLVKEAKKFKDTTKMTITHKGNGKTADLTKLMNVMSLAVKQNDTVLVTCEGGDEAAVAATLEEFFKANL